MAGRLAFLAVLASPTLVLAIVLIIIVMAAGAAGADPAAVGGTGQAVSCAVSTKGQKPDAATQQLLDELWPIYENASEKYQLGSRGPATLAAINIIETNLGRNAVVSSAGAVGWMQFMPGTWRAYGVDANGDGKADPANKHDAIFSAANYLRASGAPDRWHDAIFAYNHAEWYVKKVEDQADVLDGHCSNPEVGGDSFAMPEGYRATLKPDGTVVAKGAPPIVQKIIRAANQISNKPYGPDIGGGHPPSEKIDDTYDCSGATMWILRNAGLLDFRNWVAQDFMTYGEPVKPGDPVPWVTVLANEGHVFMIIAGLRYDVENPRRVGPAWHNDSRVFDGFVARRPPGMSSAGAEART